VLVVPLSSVSHNLPGRPDPRSPPAYTQYRLRYSQADEPDAQAEKREIQYPFDHLYRDSAARYATIVTPAAQTSSHGLFRIVPADVVTDHIPLISADFLRRSGRML